MLLYRHRRSHGGVSSYLDSSSAGIEVWTSPRNSSEMYVHLLYFGQRLAKYLIMAANTCSFFSFLCFFSNATLVDHRAQLDRTLPHVRKSASQIWKFTSKIWHFSPLKSGAQKLPIFRKKKAWRSDEAFDYFWSRNQQAKRRRCVKETT